MCLTKLQNKLITRLLQWIFFSVVIGLVPIIFLYIRGILWSKPVEFQILLKHGELFLISTVILAGAIGDLIYTDPRKKIWHLITLASSILILLGTAFTPPLVNGKRVPIRMELPLKFRLE